MAPVRAFPAGGEALGKGWRGGGIDVGRRELFTRYRGTRPFNSYGRNDNIVGGGEECLENASSSTPACIVTLRDEFEKDNFSARFAIRRERKTDATKRGGGFLSNKLFETIRERRAAFVPPPPPPRRPFPCYFNWADTPPVIEVSVVSEKKKKSKTPGQNFSASLSIRGMITVREGRFSLSLFLARPPVESLSNSFPFSSAFPSPFPFPSKNPQNGPPIITSSFSR